MRIGLVYGEARPVDARGGDGLPARGPHDGGRETHVAGNERVKSVWHERGTRDPDRLQDRASRFTERGHFEERGRGDPPYLLGPEDGVSQIVRTHPGRTHATEKLRDDLVLDVQLDSRLIDDDRLAGQDRAFPLAEPAGDKGAIRDACLGREIRACPIAAAAGERRRQGEDQLRQNRDALRIERTRFARQSADGEGGGTRRVLSPRNLEIFFRHRDLSFSGRSPSFGRSLSQERRIPITCLPVRVPPQ